MAKRAMTAFRHGPKPTLGLVGGIGAGKSTVAALLATRGGVVISGDALGHQALECPEIRRLVLDRWGSRGTLVKADGRLDRRVLGSIVFAEPAERHALESLVFPYIKERLRQEIEKTQADPKAQFAVVDAAVMFEAGWDGACDRILYVDAPRSVRLARLTARSGWTDAELATREAAQWPTERKKQRADAVIVNDAGSESLEQQLDRVLTGWGIAPPPPGGTEAAR